MSSSSASSPPSNFFSDAPASTAPSTPPSLPAESEDDAKMLDGANEAEFLISAEGTDARYKQLSYVLEKSSMFSNILKERMEADRARQQAEFQRREEEKAAKAAKKKSVRPRLKRKGKKRVRDEDSEEEQDVPSKRRKGDDGEPVEDAAVEEPPIFTQPALITGAKLKNYQLEGLQWLVSLHQNGISGILADEMGLGKTLQTIAFSAYLREERFSMPFMVVCPLSVLHNWVSEYEKFAPDIPVCMYHGTRDERAELRRTVMALPIIKKKAPVKKAKPKAKPQRGARRSGRQSRKKAESEEEPEEEEDEGETDLDAALAFPVVITTYEMIMKDRAQLAHYNWGYIVVDEGHRLKNLNCQLMKEIKKYSSAGRMILTGTPLQNNLSELWALMSFVLPDLFSDVDSFDEWFNLPAMQQHLGSDCSTQVVDALHAILKPFLLRRMKTDVETSLPPKKEYVLYAPLSEQQREAYTQVVNGTLRSYLIGGAPVEPTEPVAVTDGPRKLRSEGRTTGRKSYAVDGDDDEYFDMLERDELDERGVKQAEDSVNLARLSEAHKHKATIKKVNNMKLQNTLVQLRKVCSHPFLFEWPLDPDTRQPILNEQIVDVSGKMMVLDRLLTELFKRKHKVLLFSQFTTMLDIIEDWACELKGWKICRIDGQTAPLERREQMNKFQNGGDAVDAPCLFLLSTRAGGLGINLVAADTVIFFDQDWNPQMDAQAQDRAHRIGQTKPVLIFRLVSAHTIETKIMQRATEKRQLEALVIAKGKFKTPAAAAVQRGRAETMAEMAASLLKLEGEKIEVVPNTTAGKANVLSDADLDMLLDRRPEVFADRGQGWTSADDAPTVEAAAGKKAAFAVYQAPSNEGNDVLAKMLDQDVE